MKHKITDQYGTSHLFTEGALTHFRGIVRQSLTDRRDLTYTIRVLKERQSVTLAWNKEKLSVLLLELDSILDSTASVRGDTNV